MDVSKLDLKLRIAKGLEKADLVLKNANIINVFSSEIIKGDIAIDKGEILGIGQYYGKEEIDLEGKYVAPGFIDGHVHIESSMVTPDQFAKAIVPRGVTTIIADPHEIANVKGIDGIKYMIEASENLPLDVYIMLPSCVPSTPFENAGAVLEAEDLQELIDHPKVLGLGEMMNYPGVIERDKKVLNKLLMAQGKIIDGHGPVIKDKDLNTYVLSGVETEHECSTLEEMEDRLRLGMYIQIREGSAARNLKTLIKGVNKDNLRRVLFCTDDKNSSDLLKEGSIDNNIREAVKHGLDPIDAIKMATINPAEAYRLKGKGAIAPGYKADLVVFDDLKEFHIEKVFKEGKLVGQDYKTLVDVPGYSPESMMDTVNYKELKADDLKIKLEKDLVNVIKLLPHELVTNKVERRVTVENGEFIPKDDFLKVGVIERHKATGNIGLGIVQGFGLKDGALASTIAHDSHNLIVIGDNDQDMFKAIEELKRVGGGITIVSKGQVLDTLPLKIAGLMSEGTLEELDIKLTEMTKIAYDKLGVVRDVDPFMTLSFIALPVIPDLKLTDMGLFDVLDFKFLPLEVEEA